MKHNKISIPAVITATLLATVAVTACAAVTIDSALPQAHDCNTALLVRANANMTSQQLNDSCNKMTTETSYFHQRLETNGLPIANDTNDTLEVYLFGSEQDYKSQARGLFDVTTDNGGQYLEGDAQYESIFLAYQLPSGDVWNLEHEYVHYLDGRFVMEGGYAVEEIGVNVVNVLQGFEG